MKRHEISTLHKDVISLKQILQDLSEISSADYNKHIFDEVVVIQKSISDNIDRIDEIIEKDVY